MRNSLLVYLGGYTFQVSIIKVGKPELLITDGVYLMTKHKLIWLVLCKGTICVVVGTEWLVPNGPMPYS